MADLDHGQGLSAQERADLLMTARQRLRRGAVLLALLGVLAGGGMMVSVLQVRADLPPGRDATWLWIGGSLLAVVVVLTFALPAIALRRRGRDPELLLGAGRSTRRSVRRALRDGHAADTRIDALAREAARHQMHLLRGRRRFLPWALVAAAGLYLAAAIVLLAGDGLIITKGSVALGMVSLGLLAVNLFVSVRRCRRYLATTALGSGADPAVTRGPDEVPRPPQGSNL